jgi:hypothetical protein
MDKTLFHSEEQYIWIVKTKDNVALKINNMSGADISYAIHCLQKELFDTKIARKNEILKKRKKK